MCNVHVYFIVYKTSESLSVFNYFCTHEAINSETQRQKCKEAVFLLHHAAHLMNT